MRLSGISQSKFAVHWQGEPAGQLRQRWVVRDWRSEGGGYVQVTPSGVQAGCWPVTTLPN